MKCFQCDFQQSRPARFEPVLFRSPFYFIQRLKLKVLLLLFYTVVNSIPSKYVVCAFHVQNYRETLLKAEFPTYSEMFRSHVTVLSRTLAKITRMNDFHIWRRLCTDPCLWRNDVYLYRYSYETWPLISPLKSYVQVEGNIWSKNFSVGVVPPSEDTANRQVCATVWKLKAAYSDIRPHPHRPPSRKKKWHRVVKASAVCGILAWIGSVTGSFPWAQSLSLVTLSKDTCQSDVRPDAWLL